MDSYSESSVYLHARSSHTVYLMSKHKLNFNAKVPEYSRKGPWPTLGEIHKINTYIEYIRRNYNT